MADPVSTRTNLIRQPVPVQAGGWESYSPSLYVPTIDASGGRRAATGARKFTRSASSPDAVLAYFRYVGALSDAIADEAAAGSPGLAYTASVYIKASVACRATFSFRAYNAAAGELIRVASPEVTAGAGAWARVTCTMTAPANTAWLGVHGFYVRTQSGNSAGGIEVWATDAMIEQVGSAGSYFDGGMPDFTVDDLTYQHSWLGTVNLSASRQDAYEAGGEEKSATASIPITVASAGTGSKAASAGSALSVALVAGSPAAKQGSALTLLAAVLGLTGSAGKAGAVTSALDVGLGVGLSAPSKSGASAADLPTLLGLAGTAGKVAAASAAVPAEVAVDGAAEKATASMAGTHVGVGLAASPAKIGDAATTLATTLGLLAAAGKSAEADTAVALLLLIASTASQDRAATTALTVELGLAAGAEKTADTAALLDLLVTLASTSEMVRAALTSISVGLSVAAAASKDTTTLTGLDVLLGVHADTTKTAAADAGIDLGLLLAGHPDEVPPEHHEAVAGIALGLLMDSISSTDRYTGTLLTLATTLAGDADKSVHVAVPLLLALDAIATVAKTGGAAAALHLALTIAASVRTQGRDITIHVGPASRPSITVGDARHRTIHPGRTL